MPTEHDPEQELGICCADHPLQPSQRLVAAASGPASTLHGKADDVFVICKVHMLTLCLYTPGRALHVPEQY